jgi:predicted amidohydrolase YtcJ
MPHEDEIVQKCTFVLPNNSSHQRLKNQRTPDMSHIEKQKGRGAPGQPRGITKAKTAKRINKCVKTLNHQKNQVQIVCRTPDNQNPTAMT